MILSYRRPRSRQTTAVLGSLMLIWAVLLLADLTVADVDPMVYVVTASLVIGGWLLAGLRPAPQAFVIEPRPRTATDVTDRRWNDALWLLRDANTPEGWEGGAGPHLAGLARQILQTRYSIDCESNPEAARVQAGEEIWALIQGDLPAPATQTHLAALIERIRTL